MQQLHCTSECDVPVPGIFNFFGTIGTGIGRNWYRKKSRKNLVLEKKSWNQYQKYLVPETIFIAKIFEFRRFVMGTGTVQEPIPGIF